MESVSCCVRARFDTNNNIPLVSLSAWDLLGAGSPQVTAPTTCPNTRKIIKKKLAHHDTCSINELVFNSTLHYSENNRLISFSLLVIYWLPTTWAIRCSTVECLQLRRQENNVREISRIKSVSHFLLVFHLKNKDK
jgi:hypothetical protein